MTDRELLELLVEKVTGMEQKVTDMEKTLNHHSEMFGALIEASEIQKAQHDALQMEVAKLSGEQKEAFEALADMYGQHEFEFAKLRRKSI